MVMLIPTSREYHLTVRQEPKQARMCGVGGKADRRPIDPPPIVQLRVVDPAAKARSRGRRRRRRDRGEDEDDEEDEEDAERQAKNYFHVQSHEWMLITLL
ncbi:hypothetical protein H0H87_001252 [Tephrocybe sp. NHM501043]|nr:hypothetical protein H0H87_001252 [Tephrocybe sp. NHM501043]